MINRIIFVIFIVGILGIPGMAMANGNWYASADAGNSWFGDLYTNNLPPSASVTNTDTGYLLTAGYSFNRYFAVEAGYVDFGTGHANNCIYLVACISGTPLETKANGLTLKAVGKYHFTSRFWAFGKFGIVDGHVETKYASYDENASNTGFTFGFGIAYDFSEHWGVHAQWGQYQNLGDANTGRGNYSLSSVGLSYSFH